MNTSQGGDPPSDLSIPRWAYALFTVAVVAIGAVAWIVARRGSSVATSSSPPSTIVVAAPTTAPAVAPTTPPAVAANVVAPLYKIKEHDVSDYPGKTMVRTRLIAQEPLTEENLRELIRQIVKKIDSGRYRNFNPPNVVALFIYSSDPNADNAGAGWVARYWRNPFDPTSPQPTIDIQRNELRWRTSADGLVTNPAFRRNPAFLGQRDSDPPGEFGSPPLTSP